MIYVCNHCKVTYKLLAQVEEHIWLFVYNIFSSDSYKPDILWLNLAIKLILNCFYYKETIYQMIIIFWITIFSIIYIIKDLNLLKKLFIKITLINYWNCISYLLFWRLICIPEWIKKEYPFSWSCRGIY